MAMRNDPRPMLKPESPQQENVLPGTQDQTLPLLPGHEDVTVIVSPPVCAITAGGRSRPSAGWQPPAKEELQAALPQYQVLHLLGRGGMGAVYQGKQITLERLVAIKILPPELGLDDPQFVERFKNEARAMARLSHPGIIAVHEFGESRDGLLYIVMEFVEGRDIAQVIAGRKAMPVAEAVPVIMQVCEALHYAHERGIVHRDIKPSNILIGTDGVVKVADFGLAKMRHADQSQFTRSGAMLGTLHFMAPETFVIGAVVDRRADVYALGVMLYQMLTGKLPQGLFGMPSEEVAGLDPRYDAIVAKALREDRSLRYQTAAELRQELFDALNQTYSGAEEPSDGVGWYL